MSKATRLSERGFNYIDKAIAMLKKAEAEVFFETDNVDENQDKVYDMPYAFYTTKHGFYVQGNVCALDGEGNAEVFMTGEDWGDLRSMPISDLPVESIFELLKYI